ncbi:uncharacterized protein ARMOST_16506 [Armillaria ostoyae]|uniref:Uncharacterized protein n=1 Tax=Armillaria ostoyae TaxID=47428 RepID=A0A284RWF0_ARMOS|nr:uncharacterized protein ARMOST_16506 [Armillaria ostoyae]
MKQQDMTVQLRTKNPSKLWLLLPTQMETCDTIGQCLQDAGDYPDPENFLPERFCDSTGSILLNDGPEPRQFTFGYGRRVFDIRRPDGQKEPRIISHMGVMKPEPFECLFVPRSGDRLNQLLADNGVDGQFTDTL